jgi:hypothetical protein
MPLKLTVVGLMAVAFGLSGCTVPEDKARAILEANGYTEVRLGGYSMFGCSEDDDLSTEFSAKGVNGRQVEGVVCSGLVGKGATIRIERVT